ncbi:acyltransferase [Aestuariibacter halophilus]|uniref:Acyltransferase n=1 Tax=Fluctibacter halophilus TaxID=226011 RepID=A0ABS8G9I3_9ALTE|nr:acyltransferase family protein [Aestuariibacter halophilus]MCC2617234.1 acyltransferase [Aestuariibacter halophilus]
MQYRSEIDGLRAIAVLSVIFYHAKTILFGSYLFEGGFLGVDIFFVISGYLISKIILQEIQDSGTFSYSRFYERRARRILPVLLVVFIASFPFAWALLLPTAFVEYSKSIISSVFFGSNFFFYFATTEYGADSSLLKPFLHTWSLSVEEQFYLLFPMLAIFGSRLLGKKVGWLFIAVAVISLVFSQLYVSINSDLNFYLPFSRAWELLAGSLVAVWQLRRLSPHISALQRNVIVIIGMLMILFSLFTFSSTTPHPSIWTVVPVLGTVLVLMYSNGKDFVGRCLSLKPVVYIGLISYSLYLWHFPVFAFLRHIIPEFDLVSGSIAIASTVLLSVVSYTYVETPFRSRSFIGLPKFSYIMLSTTVLILISLSHVVFTGGDYKRFNEALPGLADFEADNQKLRQERLAYLQTFSYQFKENTDGYDVLVVGNSKAHDLYSALMETNGYWKNLQYHRADYQLSCFSTDNDVAEAFFNSDKFVHADIVVVSTLYFMQKACPKLGSEPMDFMVGLNRLGSKVRETGKAFVVVKEGAYFPKDGRKILADRLLDGMAIESIADAKRYIEMVNHTAFNVKKDVSKINEFILEIAHKYDAVVLSSEDFVCDREEQTCFLMGDQGVKYFWDELHLTPQGARFFGERIVETNWFSPVVTVLEQQARN